MKLKIITALTLSVIASSSYASLRDDVFFNDSDSQARNITIFVGDSYQRIKIKKLNNRNEDVTSYGGTVGAEFAFNKYLSALVSETFSHVDDSLSGDNTAEGWILDTHLMAKLGYPINESRNVSFFPYAKLGIDVQYMDLDEEGAQGYIIDDVRDTKVGFAYGAGIDMAIHKKYIIGLGVGGSNIHFKNHVKAKNTQAVLSFGYRF